MAGALDLRRARACFKDMNGRLEEFRSWSASRKRSDAVSCDGSRAVLLTDSEVCARREAREEQIRVALWDRAQQLLEARRTERLELRDTLSAETARTKGDVNARVGAALKAAADGVAKARSSKEKLKAEAERLRGELARKRELEEQEQDEEDERVARENAQANKRQRTTDEDPQTRIRTMMELIASGKERISALGTDTINAKREREAEEAVVAEHKRELESLRVQSGAYEGERSLAELMDQVRQDRKVCLPIALPLLDKLPTSLLTPAVGHLERAIFRKPRCRDLPLYSKPLSLTPPIPRPSSQASRPAPRGTRTAPSRSAMRS